MSRLQDRVAIVTGGASGIGAAAVRAFAREGAKVIIADINEESGQRIAHEIGDGGLFVRLDHTSRTDNEAAVATALDRFGKLDILYNNAGIGMAGAFDKVDDDALMRILTVDLVGPFRMTQAALPALRKSAAARKDGAAIVFTASLQGISARPNLSPYTAAKLGIVGLVRSLALELAPERIRVNAVCPVATDTPMLWGSVPANWDAAKLAVARARSGQAIPLGRIADPEDSANAALFLASDEAAMITGVALPVDGGMSAGTQGRPVQH